MSKSCPISLKSVDANLIRINSVYITLVFTLFLFTQEIPIILFLVIDFITRVLIKKEYSLLFMISKFTQEKLAVQKDIVDEAPKKLASFFGLAFVIIIACASLLHLQTFAYVVSSILLACLMLEVIFSYCLGCEIYHLYKKFSL